MQGTVKEFSEETRSGTVVLDDGTVLPLSAQAFSSSGLRMLRMGQRVRLVTDGEGEARSIQQIELATL